MEQPVILHIETATDICSVAVSQGERRASLVESGPERSHATLLNSLIRQALAESGSEFSGIDAVAVSKGPGSYTGLRIGVSTAKGISYALKIPLLATGTLENMAHGALSNPDIGKSLRQHGKHLLLCPMLDARRMEVYSCFFSKDMEIRREVSADIVGEDSFRELLDSNHICFFGNGAVKCKEVIHHPHAYFIEGIEPSAAHMIGPVLERYRLHQFEDTAYFEPFYLKDFIATIPRKKVL
jgi:tRNA threonylcarbamoyladenosine biosynthesis protein TsaB